MNQATITRTHLFIGGCADYQRLEVEDGFNRLAISHQKFDPHISPAPRKRPDYSTDTYYLERLSCGRGVTLTFWRFEELPIRKAILRLFENYKLPESDHG